MAARLALVERPEAVIEVAAEIQSPESLVITTAAPLRRVEISAVADLGIR